MKTQRLKAAIAANPDSADLYKKLGNAHFAEGEPGESLGAFLMALVLAPSDRDNRRNALKLLGMTSGYQLPGQVRNLLAQCADDRDLDIQALASVIHTEFESGSIVDLLVQDLAGTDRAKVRRDLARGVYNQVLGDDLLKAAMINTVMITPAVEHLLTGLRKFFLETLVENNDEPDALMAGHADFISALACQCFNTEYVFAVSQHELDSVSRLVSNPRARQNIITLSVIDSYRHLHTLPSDQILDSSELTPLQLRMMARLLEEPRHEAQVADDIPVASGIEDQTSQAVQAQYERFPYPRWTSLNSVSSPLRFGKYVRQRFPQVRSKQVPQGNIEILVAGCGTGKQAIEVAMTYKNAAVTAVDLSRTSLAYAKARAGERGLDNITFLQGDILNLGQLGSSFDLIECMGVLHHMAKPEDGLDVLTSLLKPNGFLRLALYSYRARPEVRDAASYIADLGLDGSEGAVREFRHRVYQLPENSAVAKVIKTREFFSMSGLHDYVFNVHEKTYSPRELQGLLASANLEFLGFDLSSGQAGASYRELNPSDRSMSDLEAWDRYEADHPDTFEQMFQFWCRPVRPGK